jgi:prolipoprotein diacylglyceryltransferase
LAAFCTFGLLYSFWYFVGYGKDHRKPRFAIGKPGTTFALMFICYGIWRFCVEFLRDDNPFEMIGLTISQLISTGLVAFAVILFFVFAKMRTDDIALKAQLSRSR